MCIQTCATKHWAVQAVDGRGTEAVIFAKGTLLKNPNQPPFQRKILQVMSSSDGSASVKTFTYKRPIVVGA